MIVVLFTEKVIKTIEFIELNIIFVIVNYVENLAINLIFSLSSLKFKSLLAINYLGLYAKY